MTDKVICEMCGTSKKKMMGLIGFKDHEVQVVRFFCPTCYSIYSRSSHMLADKLDPEKTKHVIEKAKILVDKHYQKIKKEWGKVK